MYSIRSSKQPVPCRPNILPCKISHNGPVNASKRHWNPEEDDSGNHVVYFRGRKLQGKRVKLPDDYRGAVLEKTSEVVVPVKPSLPLSPREEEEEEDFGEDEPEEEVKVMQELASFDHITVWGHEVVPGDADNPYLKGIEEWMAFAKAMHSHDAPDEAMTKAN